ncbi:MAG TPA: sugar phosphate isomerase/epimerase, partial [Phycisphaerae bacterium]|nr:sugar phosphate isomerase/epimerase [Phycisphaerae bacterium]
ALQNHKPIINHYQDMLDFIAEVNSPALKACLDAPLMSDHSEAHYRAAIEATGELFVHSHFGGRFVADADGNVDLLGKRHADYPTFMRLAKANGFTGHTGYELCSPVLTGHRHEGLDYALQQAELACRYMRGIIDSL